VQPVVPLRRDSLRVTSLTVELNPPLILTSLALQVTVPLPLAAAAAKNASPAPSSRSSKWTGGRSDAALSDQSPSGSASGTGSGIGAVRMSPRSWLDDRHITRQPPAATFSMVPVPEMFATFAIFANFNTLGPFVRMPRPVPQSACPPIHAYHPEALAGGISTGRRFMTTSKWAGVMS